MAVRNAAAKLTAMDSVSREIQTDLTMRGRMVFGKIGYAWTL